MTEDFYYTIQAAAVSEFKDRGSKFIAYAYPISTKEDFKQKLAALKKEHPKANHHCFAYRIGMDGNEFRVSDDGEPSGTAGRPILGQIDSRKLANVLVVVVRYFGGTLLGVPGLINAYKTCTAFALDGAKRIGKSRVVTIKLEYDYTKINDVMRVIKQFNCVITNQEIQLFSRIQVEVPVGKVNDVRSAFMKISGIIILN